MATFENINFMKFYWDEFAQDIKASTLPGQVVLDAGAGDCHWKKIFSSDIKYLGMDLGVGDENCNYSNLDILGDLRDIPLERDSVDVIISIQVLEHLPEPWKVLAEFHRVLKPGGLLFISCPQAVELHQIPYDFFRFTPFGLKSLLSTYGFETIWIKPQLGNFSKITHDACYSLRKLPSITNNLIKKMILQFVSFYLRQVMWRIHAPLFTYLDNFEQFQDNHIGHFLKARKCH